MNTFFGSSPLIIRCTIKMHFFLYFFILYIHVYCSYEKEINPHFGTSILLHTCVYQIEQNEFEVTVWPFLTAFNTNYSSLLYIWQSILFSSYFWYKIKKNDRFMCKTSLRCTWFKYFCHAFQIMKNSKYNELI